jgi:glucose dehydrogenase
MRFTFKVARASACSISAARTARRRKGAIIATKVLIGIFVALVMAGGVIPSSAADMTDERASNPQREPQNWILHHGNYAGHRFSALKEINTDTVKTLKLVFSVALSGFGAGAHPCRHYRSPMLRL